MEGKKIRNYTLEKRIGKGGQATVWKAISEQGGYVAIKKMPIGSNGDNTKSFNREVAIKKLVSHEYLVKSLNTFEEGSNYYFVYEFCPCDLLTLLQQQNSHRFPEDKAKKWMYQLVQVMHYLNKNNIIHRDLKPENILLTADTFEADIRLADFGLAREDFSMSSTVSYVGTLEYASPEIKSCLEYSFNTDVWSLGVIYFAIVFGKLPIMRENKVVYPNINLGISTETKRFIEKCLIYDRKIRPGFDALLNDSFFDEFNSNEVLKTAPSTSFSIKPENKPGTEIDFKAPPEIRKNTDIDMLREFETAFDRREITLNTDSEIEQHVFEVFALSSDVMDFAERVGAEMGFVKYLISKHFTEKFKYILDNITKRPFIQQFGREFFENFFLSSERICSVFTELEYEYKNLGKDDWIAIAWQLEELIADHRADTAGHILVVLQEISHSIRSDLI